MNQAPRTPESRAENLDALLSDFFRAEMPAPWPDFRAPARTRLAPPAPRAEASGWSSRLALVAAVALLLLGAWMLPSPSGPACAERPGSFPGMTEGTATGGHGLEKTSSPAKPRPRPADKAKPAGPPR